VPVSQPLGERVGQSRTPDCDNRALDVVLDAVKVHSLGIEVQLEPGGARVAVARLADAAGIDQPGSLPDLQPAFDEFANDLKRAAESK